MSDHCIVNDYCQFSQQACTNFMKTYLYSLISTSFFILTTNVHCIISKTKYICQKILDLHNNTVAPIFYIALYSIKDVICSLKNERLPFLFWGTFYCEDLISSDKFCVACHQGYSCHNALRYIRYVDISILYRTLPQEGAIHKLWT